MARWAAAVACAEPWRRAFARTTSSAATTNPGPRSAMSTWPRARHPPQNWTNRSTRGVGDNKHDTPSSSSPRQSRLPSAPCSVGVKGPHLPAGSRMSSNSPLERWPPACFHALSPMSERAPPLARNRSRAPDARHLRRAAGMTARLHGSSSVPALWSCFRYRSGSRTRKDGIRRG